MNVVAVRETVRTKLCTVALNCCHFDLKVFCCPWVTGFCVVSLQAAIGFLAVKCLSIYQLPSEDAMERSLLEVQPSGLHTRADS